jgi:hypothetical protein
MAVSITSLSPCLSRSCPDSKDFQINGLSIDCPESIKPYLSMILSHQNAEPLVHRVKEILESPKVKIELIESEEEPEAYVDFKKETIYINLSKCPPAGDEIALKVHMAAFAVFELSNLSRKKEFQAVDKETDLTIDEFVAKKEEVEFDSTRETHHIVEALIKTGNLPATTPFHFICPEFREHYLLQQIAGHQKNWIDKFNELHPSSSERYKGSWPRPVEPFMVTTLRYCIALFVQMQLEPEESRRIACQDELMRRLSQTQILSRASPLLKDLLANIEFISSPKLS